MPAIRILTDEVKNKIAAGEVVERPASVVKELVENSLDAGSSSVGIEVHGSGTKLIRVEDDGMGMDREDALLCLERHATSKLSSGKDLESIRTLGFRGEALPSIAAVSRMTLTTAPRGDSLGVRLEAVAGEVNSVTGVAARGTTVEVRDLFFNTPARKKFLKSRGTELIHIVDAVTRLSLSHPGAGMRLVTDGQKAMELPASSGPRERLLQLYGGEFLDGLIEAGLDSAEMSVRAFVSRPGNFRESRSHQMVFINGRPVREPSLAHAVHASYDALPGGKHPIFFLFIEMDPARVDFNVHPAKREVRFADKDIVYRGVRRCVSDAVRAKPVAAPPGGADVSSAEQYPEDAGHRFSSAGAGAVAESIPLQYRAELSFIFLGETFVAYSAGGGLTLLDHHAAHERVLYEKLLKRTGLAGLRLLFPRQVRLGHREYLSVLEHREMLLDLGIEAEDFGGDTVVVRSLPEAMEGADLGGILSDAAEAMMSGERPGQSLKEAVAARIACHGSVRGRKILTPESLNALLADLDASDDPDHCPHGRPTRIRYSLEDLRKLFKRK